MVYQNILHDNQLLIHPLLLVKSNGGLFTSAIIDIKKNINERKTNEIEGTEGFLDHHYIIPKCKCLML